MLLGVGMRGGRLVPARCQIPQILIHQGQEIVLGVVFVVIRDACEVHYGLPVKIVAMRMNGCSSVSSVSRIHFEYSL